MSTNNSINANAATPFSAIYGGTGVSSPTVHGIVLAQGASAMTSLVLGAGQIPIGTTSGDPAAAAINSGTGIIVANGSGSITVSATGGGMAWSTIAGTTQSAAVDHGYIIGNAGQTTVTLPGTAAIGSTVSIAGLGAGGWVLAPAGGQTIKVLTASASTSIASAEQYDCIEVVCVTANTTWVVSDFTSTGLIVT